MNVAQVYLLLFENISTDSVHFYEGFRKRYIFIRSHDLHLHIALGMRFTETETHSKRVIQISSEVLQVKVRPNFPHAKTR